MPASAASSPFIPHLIVFALIRMAFFLFLEHIKRIAMSQPSPCFLLKMLFTCFTIQISTQIPVDFSCFPSEGICPSLPYPLYIIPFYHLYSYYQFWNYLLFRCLFCTGTLECKLFERLLYACPIHWWFLTRMVFNI